MDPVAQESSRISAWRPGVATLVVALAALAHSALAGPPGGGRVVLSEVPQNFERWQDSKGYSWQLTRQGSLLSGGVPYFQGAMALKLNQRPFEAARAIRLDGGQAGDAGAHLLLSGEVDGLKVTRDVWFDSVRGGIRYLDVFENPDDQPLQMAVTFTTAYQNPWQDLHAEDGRVLGGGSEAGLQGRDYGLVVKFSQAEGRHDTLLVVAGEDHPQKPQLSFSENHRELMLSYQLEIPAGGRTALVHWVLQRGLQSVREAGVVLRPFYLRRSLIDPAVPAETAPLVANFSVRPADAAPDPGDLAGLVVLNKLLEDFEIQRSGDDVLWISGINQLAGAVRRDVEVRVATRFGERSTTVAEVAAIQGGGGFGRTPRVYLRDGQVWAGVVTADGLSLESPDGVAMNDLDVAEIELLLLRLGVSDGVPPAVDGAGGGDAGVMFVALRSGDVLAVAAESANQLELLSPWGADALGFDEIEALSYSNLNAPKFRLRRSDGSRLTVFLASGSGPLFAAPQVGDAGVDANEATAGVPAASPAPSVADIVGMWRSGASQGSTGGGLDEFWLEVEDVAPLEALNLPMCLLQGNNLMHADLETEALHLVSGTSVTRLVPEEIVAIRRSDETVSEAEPIFEIELRGGDRLSGRLREKAIEIRSPSRVWQVPVQHFNSYLGDRVE